MSEENAKHEVIQAFEKGESKSDALNKILKVVSNIYKDFEMDKGMAYRDGEVSVQDNKIKKIAKYMNPNQAHGEFIGLAKFTRRGGNILKRH